MDHLIPDRKPDVVVINKKKKEKIELNFVVQGGHRKSG